MILSNCTGSHLSFVVLYVDSAIVAISPLSYCRSGSNSVSLLAFSSANRRRDSAG